MNYTKNDIGEGRDTESVDQKVHLTAVMNFMSGPQRVDD